MFMLGVMVGLLGGKYSRKLQVCHVESHIKVKGEFLNEALYCRSIIMENLCNVVLAVWACAIFPGKTQLFRLRRELLTCTSPFIEKNHDIYKCYRNKPALILITIQRNISGNEQLCIQGRLPLVRTGQPDQSISKENCTFNQSCPARSFYFYIVCIAVMSFERKLSKEAYFIFKMTAPTGQFGLLVSAPSGKNWLYHYPHVQMYVHSECINGR